MILGAVFFVILAVLALLSWQQKTRSLEPPTPPTASRMRAKIASMCSIESPRCVTLRAALDGLDTRACADAERSALQFDTLLQREGGSSDPSWHEVSQWLEQQVEQCRRAPPQPLK